VTSKQPLVALLAGWALFLVLCSVPWIVGLSANAVRPLFWIFYAAGLWSVVRGRQWTEAATTLVVTGAVAMVLLHRCYAHDGAYVFGAHGTDLWGYVQAADWLTTHSTRELPDLGTSPMRYNWTWYVLATRDRPLVLEAIACCGASTGIDAVKAYLALPVALMATLAIGIGRIPGAFGFGNWLPAVAVAAVMVFHPLPVLHWIAGFAAGSIVGLLLGLTFGAVMAAEPGPARTEALALTLVEGVVLEETEVDQVTEPVRLGEEEPLVLAETDGEVLLLADALADSDERPEADEHAVAAADAVSTTLA
jgi:hypothetical protein